MNELLNGKQVLQLIRNQKLMLDSDLAEMYGAQTKALNQSGKKS